MTTQQRWTSPFLGRITHLEHNITPIHDIFMCDDGLIAGHAVHRERCDVRLRRRTGRGDDQRPGGPWE